jgi:hypothetical protein
MAYRPFFEAESEGTPATIANPATFQPQEPQTVADVASVAGGCAEIGAGETEAAGLSAEDLQAAYDERAGILEYDHHLPRAEAERLARNQISDTVH